MFWYVIFGFLSAFGLLCAILVVHGFFFHRKTRCSVAIFCPVGCEIAVIRRFCHLRQFGLTSASLTVLDSALSSPQQRRIHTRYPYIQFCTRQVWLSGQGRECIGHGDGDPAGNHRSGGVPEL